MVVCPLGLVDASVTLTGRASVVFPGAAGGLNVWDRRSAMVKGLGEQCGE